MTQEERDALVEENMPFVAWIIKKRVSVPPGKFNEYMSAGCYGLLKAARVYDPEKGIAFSALAGRCILNEIYMMNRKENKHAAVLSYDDTVSTSEEETPYLTFLTAPDGDPSEELEQKDDYIDLYTAMRCLSPRDAEILRDLYGLGGRKAMTQAEIARRQGISQSYVARRAMRAKEKLHAIMEARQMQ